MLKKQKNIVIFLFTILFFSACNSEKKQSENTKIDSTYIETHVSYYKDILTSETKKELTKIVTNKNTKLREEVNSKVKLQELMIDTKFFNLRHEIDSTEDSLMSQMETNKDNLKLFVRLQQDTTLKKFNEETKNIDSTYNIKLNSTSDNFNDSIANIKLNLETFKKSEEKKNNFQSDSLATLSDTLTRFKARFNTRTKALDTRINKLGNELLGDYHKLLEQNEQLANANNEIKTQNNTIKEDMITYKESAENVKTALEDQNFILYLILGFLVILIIAIIVGFIQHINKY